MSGADNVLQMETAPDPCLNSRDFSDGPLSVNDSIVYSIFASSSTVIIGTSSFSAFSLFDPEPGPATR